MNNRIKVAILWHQHQPYYRSASGYRLPWVRLHATKDYIEMAEHLLRHPNVKATINLVPSLLEQIEDYTSGATDSLFALCRKPTEQLEPEERTTIVASCFHANEERIIRRSNRYTELSKHSAVFSTQELLDLIVLFHLGWTGEFARSKPLLAALIKKDRHFTEEQKQQLLDEHEAMLREVIPIHRHLMETGSVELSSTPFYHPILPLLCDTNSAQDATPLVAMPKKRFSSQADASEHVRRSVQYHSRLFGKAPSGMWPAEGSISNQALELIALHGVAWAASDETVLLNSLSEAETQYGQFEKYFPRVLERSGNKIVVFFRDHDLSDRIGFDYARRSAADAVNDLIGSINHIRSGILDSFGEDVLRSACISIILDGENCWEHYEHNGMEFLDTLYSTLGNSDEIETVTFSEALGAIAQEKIRPIGSIRAGSWIGGNFKIWIGHPEKNQAWELLADASRFVAIHDERVSGYGEAKRSLMQAEGSDWFWWYGDDHLSSERLIFDELFRSHLRDVYRHLGAEPPAALASPIMSGQSDGRFGAMHRA